jgi:hypothetical protein
MSELDSIIPHPILTFAYDFPHVARIPFSFFAKSAYFLMTGQWGGEEMRM